MKTYQMVTIPSYVYLLAIGNFFRSPSQRSSVFCIHNKFVDLAFDRYWYPRRIHGATYIFGGLIWIFLLGKAG